MPTLPFLLFLVPTLVALGLLAMFLLYVAIRYSPIVGRIFEEQPLFLPLRVSPREGDGETVQFHTKKGLKLEGTYLKARTSSRVGVLVYCHEFLSDRWSYAPYIDHLRDQGFDIFTFDFRNHGKSERDAVYKPLQWVTNHEKADLKAALTYLRSRPDRDEAGYGLFGVSRGGGSALVAAADDPLVWGVMTDGAFPTRGTMLAYTLRWAEIYVGSPVVWKRMPLWMFAYVAWSGRIRSQGKLNCRFSNVERAAARLSPRPWLMIHGGKDAYIGPEIARRLFAEASEPKELWIVPGAKHNRCRQTQPEQYMERVGAFLEMAAPRRPVSIAVPNGDSATKIVAPKTEQKATASGVA